jgi:hypothetical protein
MRSVGEYVRSLPDDEKRLIANGWELFEKEGAIGDDPLRLHAEEMMKETSSPASMVTFWMQQLAFEVYRYYAERMFEEIDDPLSPRNQAQAEKGLD